MPAPGYLEKTALRETGYWKVIGARCVEYGTKEECEQVWVDPPDGSDSGGGDECARACHASYEEIWVQLENGEQVLTTGRQVPFGCRCL